MALTVRRAQPAPQGWTARVVRVDASGVWVALLGEPMEHPIGPCRGITPPEDALVLLIHTQEAPWVVAYEEIS